jgi:hypothetical protein
MVMAWKLSKCLNAFDRISQQAMEVMDVHWQAHVILLEYERNFHLSNVDDQRVSFSRTGRSDISFRSCANTVRVLAFFITADTRSIIPSSCGWFEIHFLTARYFVRPATDKRYLQQRSHATVYNAILPHKAHNVVFRLTIICSHYLSQVMQMILSCHPFYIIGE